MQKNGTDTGDRYKYKKVVLILDIGTNTEKQYRYGRSVRISKSNMILENGSIKGFKLFTTIKKIIVKLPTGKRVSEHSSDAK